MAIYHFSAKIVSRGKGQSAVNTAAYVLKEKLHDDELRRSFNYEKNSDEVKFRETLVPEKIRERVKSAEDFWNDIQNNVEKGEKAQLAKRLDIALPKELSREQQIALGHDYAMHLAKQGYGVTWALHDKDGSNPHIDMLVTLRRFDEAKQKWGPKSKKVYKLDKDGNRIPVKKKKKNDRHDFERIKVLENGKTLKQDLRDERQFWQDLANKHLARAGRKERIDARSYKEQQEEIRAKMTRASRRHDYATAQKLAEKSDEVFRTPQNKEYYFGGVRNPVIHQVNEENAKDDREASKQHSEAADFFKSQKQAEAIKEKRRDQYWQKRQKNRWRTRRTQQQQARARGCKPTPRDIGRASTPAGKPGKLPSRTPVRIYSDVYEMIAAEHLDRDRVADQIAESFFVGFSKGKMLQGKGKKLTGHEKDKIRKFFRRALKRGAFRGIPAVFTAGKKGAALTVKGAAIGGKAAAGMMRVTAQMMRGVASIARLVPLVGKPISAAVNGAADGVEACGKVTRIASDAVNNAADRAAGKGKAPAQRGGGGDGGRQQRGGQQDDRRDQHDERDGGLPASSAEARKERDNGLDDWRFLSECARADKEMEDFLAEVFGGPSRSR